MSKPIELFYWPTPNGWKVTIMLEELGLPYLVTPIDIGKGDQFSAQFLTLNPNNKIPAIRDPMGPGGEPLQLFESGAILIYLAEKTGRLLARDVGGRAITLQWLMFQMGGVGPMLGQAHHFRIYATERIEYAVKRYTNEAIRIYRVLDRRLAESEFLAGDYSIADIATFPWISRHERQGQRIRDYPNLFRWYQMLSDRPAVQRGMDVLRENQSAGAFDASAHEVLFGSSQIEQRKPA